MNTPQSKYAYIAPTYKQAKNVAWDLLKQSVTLVHNIKINESELRVDLFNQSRITLYGSDNPDALRGLGLWGVVFDEYSQQPSNIFTEIIRPALADHQGYAVWIGTPKGRNDFYRLYKGLDDNDKPKKNLDKWLRILLTVDDTGLIPQSELEDSRAEMTEDEYQQEWYCSFDAAIKGAYYAEELSKARQDKRITKVDWDNTLPVYTVWDLGISDAMAIGFWQRVRQEMRLIDYYESTDRGLPHYTKIIQNKPYTYAKHFAPHDINQRELTTGRTRLEIAKELGINYVVLPKLGVADGIHAGRLMFDRLWVNNENCQTWIDYIAQYHREWDDNRGCFKDNPYHDFTSHAADMYRYAALAEKMMTQSSGSILDDSPQVLTEFSPVIRDGFIHGEEMGAGPVFAEEEPRDYRY
jgi:hypothetical protein